MYSATWVVWATVALVVVLFWGAYFIARAGGHFDDLEQIKFKVLEDETDDASG